MPTRRSPAPTAAGGGTETAKSGGGARGADAGPCPAGMVLITSYCIDRWEAYVVELDDAGAEQPHSPFDVVDGLTVRAKTAGGVPPQGYISQGQATAAGGA